MSKIQDDLVPVVIDLNVAKSGEVNEIFLKFWGDVVKGIMLQFVKSTRGGDSQHNISVAPLKKRREQSMIIRNILIVSLFLFFIDRILSSLLQVIL